MQLLYTCWCLGLSFVWQTLAKPCDGVSMRHVSPPRPNAAARAWAPATARPQRLDGRLRGASATPHADTPCMALFVTILNCRQNMPYMDGLGHVAMPRWLQKGVTRRRVWKQACDMRTSFRPGGQLRRAACFGGSTPEWFITHKYTQSGMFSRVTCHQQSKRLQYGYIIILNNPTHPE